MLDYVIGPGRGDQRDFAFRWVRLDMVFTVPTGRVLVVEYDGAYWHRNEEERDFRKARMVEEAWRNRGCMVVRIREDPLTPLCPIGVQVPARCDALTCARLVFLHLLHMMPDDIGDRYGEGEIGSFLRSSRRPLSRADVRCEQCEYVASDLLSAGVFPRVPSPQKKRTAAVLPDFDQASAHPGLVVLILGGQRSFIAGEAAVSHGGGQPDRCGMRVFASGSPRAGSPPAWRQVVVLVTVPRWEGAMEQGITWYDVLGVMPGAETRKIRQEYEAKSALLRPDMIAGAPPNVLTAITRAQDLLDRAWEVLADPDSRNRYDEQIGIRRSGGGLDHPPAGPSDPAFGPDDMGIAEDLPVVGELLALLAGGLVRRPRSPRPVAVPDVRGLFYHECAEVAWRHRLQVTVVRLTERPMAVDGLVVGQDPPPGAVRQGGQLTVQLWHPPAR